MVDVYRFGNESSLACRAHSHGARLLYNFGDKEFLAGGHEIGTALIAMLRDRRSGDARHIAILSQVLGDRRVTNAHRGRVQQ